MSFEPIAPIVKNHPKPTGTKWARMRDWLLALFTLYLSLLISRCGLDIEDPNPPSAPVWIQKSLPEEWPERGIDAHESGGIFLEWEANPEDNVFAYLVYRAELIGENDSLSTYELVNRIETEIKSDLHYLDMDVSMRTEYYYKLKVEDYSENRSIYSDSINYCLIPQIGIGGMAPNGVSSVLTLERELTWQYVYNIEMEVYYITMLSQDNDFVFRYSVLPTNYIDDTESWTIPINIRLDSNSRYKWRIDTGAKYFNNLETCGSESFWAIFNYIED
jgi:hypothetical protein